MISIQKQFVENLSKLDGLSPCKLKLKNLNTLKTKNHICDTKHQYNRLKLYFKQTGNYEVLE